MAIRHVQYGLTLLATLVLLAGCSQVDENLKPAELSPVESKYIFKRVWVKKTGEGQDARYQRLQASYDDGIIYTTDIEGRVSAVNAENGRVVWQTKLKTAIGGGVGLGSKLALVGGLDGQVTALSRETGDIVWRAQASSEIVSSPQTNDDVVVVSAIDGRIFAYDAADGALRWSYDHPVPVLTLRSNASPLVNNDQVFVGFDNGQLLSFKSTDGQLLWVARLGQPQGKTELDRLVDVDTAPIVVGPFIYSAGYKGKLIAVSRGSGRLSWASDVSTYQNIVEKDGKILVVTDESHVLAFDASTGDQLWENDKLHRRVLSAPTVTQENIVVVADDDAMVHGLSLETGELIARTRLVGDKLFAQPITHEEYLYLLDNDGYLSAYRFKTAKPGTVVHFGRDRHRGAIPTKSTIDVQPRL